MQRRQLGNSGIEVSQLCLGTMTFGEQNSETEGHQQLDYALSQGINFINSRPFLTSNIIGATTMAQLEENIASAALSVSDELLEAVEVIHSRYTYPSP